MNTTIRLNQDQLDKYLATLNLRSGGGSGVDDVCVMQAVDYIASGGRSDQPECASPVIAAFMIGLNDRLNNERRQRLKRFIPRLVGTRGTEEQEQRRRYMLRDFAVRKLAPTWFELSGFSAAAQKLRDLPEVLDDSSKRVAIDTLRALRAMCWPTAPGYYGYYSAVYNAVRAAVEKALKEKKSATADAADAATAAAADAAAADATVPKYGTPAYWAWRDNLRAKVREAVRARLEPKLGPAIERNMVLAEELIERLIAVGNEATPC